MGFSDKSEAYCRAPGWLGQPREPIPLLPLRAVGALGAIGLALGVVVALVEWSLSFADAEGKISSSSWVEDNWRINTENYKKNLGKPGDPLYRTAFLPAAVPDKERKRILVLGDSFVWGDGVMNANMTWWRQLQWELERRGYAKVDIVAAGLNGASTQDEFSWLEEEVISDNLYVRTDIEVRGNCKISSFDHRVNGIFEQGTSLRNVRLGTNHSPTVTVPVVNADTSKSSALQQFFGFFATVVFRIRGVQLIINGQSPDAAREAEQYVAHVFPHG